MNFKRLAAAAAAGVMCLSAVCMPTSDGKLALFETPIISYAADSGSYNGINWEVSGGTLTLSGSGEVNGGSYPWSGSSVSQVVAEDGISYLSSAAIPSGVSSVKILHPACLFDGSLSKSITIEGYEKSTAALWAKEHLSLIHI